MLGTSNLALFMICSFHFGHSLSYGPLLTECKGCTEEYWPEVVAVWTVQSEVHTKTTEGQYSPVLLELAGLVSSLLYGTQAMLILNLPAFEKKNYTAYDRSLGNSPYGGIPIKKEPIRMLGFTSRLPCHIIIFNNYYYSMSAHWI